jgi:hypothetical protein
LALGLASSIGSLPHHDPAAAVDLVLRTQSRLPAAPSLPRRSPAEGMIAQAAWGVPGVTVDGAGDLVVDPSAVDPEAPVADPDLAGEPWVGLRTFLDAVATRTGPVKLQLTGPITFGLALHRAGLDVETAFAVAASAVRQRAEGTVALAAKRAPAAPLVVFVDEPGLAGCTAPGFPLALDDTIDLVSGALATLEPWAVTGVHCCGPTDWKALLQAGPEILSLPVDIDVDAAGGALGAFIERGGWLAWGAVPTDRPLGTGVDRLWRALSLRWCELVQAGCDPVLLRTQAMVTPACGLALHGPSQAERVLALTTELANRLHDQAVGVRLTAGA